MSDEWRMPKHKRDRLEPFDREFLRLLDKIRGEILFLNSMILLFFIAACIARCSG